MNVFERRLRGRVEELRPRMEDRVVMSDCLAECLVEEVRRSEF